LLFCDDFFVPGGDFGVIGWYANLCFWKQDNAFS